MCCVWVVVEFDQRNCADRRMVLLQKRKDGGKRERWRRKVCGRGGSKPGVEVRVEGVWRGVAEWRHLERHQRLGQRGGRGVGERHGVGGDAAGVDRGGGRRWKTMTKESAALVGADRIIYR